MRMFLRCLEGEIEKEDKTARIENSVWKTLGLPSWCDPDVLKNWEKVRFAKLPVRVSRSYTVYTSYHSIVIKIYTM